MSESSAAREEVYGYMKNVGLRFTDGGETRWYDIWEQTTGTFIDKHPGIWSDQEFKQFTLRVCMEVVVEAHKAFKRVCPAEPLISAAILDYATVRAMVENYSECRHRLSRILKRMGTNPHVLNVVCGEYLEIPLPLSSPPT